MAAVVFVDAHVKGQVLVHDGNKFPPRIADARPPAVVSDAKATAAQPQVTVFYPAKRGDQ